MAHAIDPLCLFAKIMAPLEGVSLLTLLGIEIAMRRGGVR